MWRWFALSVIGLFALYGAWHFYVTPLDPNAPERSGWLFQQFGQQGIAVGMLLMAIVFTLIGVVGMLRWTRRFSGSVVSQKSREGAVKKARVFAAAPRAAFQRNPAGQAGIWSAFIGLISLVAGGGIAYFGLYLPFLTDRPHAMKASFAAPLMIGYGLALLLLGRGFGRTMYRRKNGFYVPTLVGTATLLVLLGLGLGLEWWLTGQLHSRRY
jgi:hypothetical protein